MDNKELLEKAIEKAIHYAESTEAFVIDQAPQLCNEIVVCARANATMPIVIMFLLWLCFVVSVPFLVRATRKLKDDTDMISARIGYLAVISIILLVITCNYCSVRDFNRAWFAPRVVVIENLRAMVGK